MKLVKIEDVRVGQIWEDKNNSINFRYYLVRATPFALGYLIMTDIFNEKYSLVKNISYMVEDLKFDSENSKKIEEIDKDLKLIGFLNITHRLEKDENGKERLVEISRSDFEVDDVVEFEMEKNKIGVIIKKFEKEYKNNAKNILYDIFYNSFVYMSVDCPLKKLGILGVNYEFVNDLLAKE